MAAQGRLHAAAERIAAHQDNAFTGFVVSPEQRKLSVYWKGRPPTAAARAIDEARRDVSVEVFDAPYSAAELQTLVDRIAGDFDYWRGIGVPITTVGARQDGSAVEVGTAYPDLDRVSRLVAQRYGAVPPIVVVRRDPVAAPMPFE